ncbi:MAG: tail fiber domain-containing protein [Bacteroidota bacterium]
MKCISKIIITCYLLLTTLHLATAQVGINSDNSDPDASAMLDVSSTDKGLLIPRMDSTSRQSISEPANGLLVFDTDFSSFWYYINTTWLNLKQTLSFADDSLTISNGNSVDLSSLKHLDSTGLTLKVEGEEIVLDVALTSQAGSSLGSPLWQSFTANNTGYLYELEARFERSIGDVTDFSFDGGKISIYEGEGTDGTLLAEMELSSMDTGWKTFDFSADSIALTSGNSYTFSIEDTADGSFELASNASNAYADGISSGNISDDLLFRIYTTLPITFEDNIIDINTNDITDASINLSLIDTLHFTDGSYLSTGTALQDADGDTKIQVEESNNEDIIRFDLGGTEFMRLDGGRIEVTNTGQSVFLGEGAGANDNFSDNENIFVGYNAGYGNTTGEGNISIGYHAGYENSTGSGNVFIGYNAGYDETGSSKLYIESGTSISPLIYGDFENDYLQINGILSIYGNYSFPTLDGNTNQILTTDGNGTLAWTDMGATVSANTISDSDGDTRIQVEETSGENIIRFDIAGTEFMKLDSGRIEITNTGSSVFIGQNAGDNDNYDDNRNVFLGFNAGRYNTSGSWNVFSGYEAGETNSTGKENVFTGYRAGFSNETGENNVFMGYNAGYSTKDGVENLILGDNAGYENESGSNNVYLGYQSGYNNQTGANNIYIGNQAGFSNTSGSNELYIDNSSTTLPLIYGDFSNDVLEFNGDVGIGTTPTNGKLEINGAIEKDLIDYTYVNNTNNDVVHIGYTVTDREISIYASDRIVGKYVISLSDERIKDIKGISDSKKDLAILNQIQITDYEFIDKIREGNTRQKKVIAQQIAEVFPQAVEKEITEIVPDIYQTAEMDEKGWVTFNGEWKMENGALAVGEKVQIFFEGKRELLEVLEIKGNTFRVKPSIVHRQPSTVFVYGRQVHDFHTVDYQAIAMLNVSATQQLAKENEALKERMTTLEQENSQLQAQVNKINQLEQQNVAMKAMMERIQVQLNRSAKTSIPFSK